MSPETIYIKSCVNSKGFLLKTWYLDQQQQGMGKRARNTKILGSKLGSEFNQILDHSLALDSWRSLGLKNDEGKAGQFMLGKETHGVLGAGPSRAVQCHVEPVFATRTAGAPGT